MLTTLCAGYVTTELRQVQQPCRDMMAHMVLAGVLRVGPTLSKVRPHRLLCYAYRGLRPLLLNNGRICPKRLLSYFVCWQRPALVRSYSLLRSLQLCGYLQAWVGGFSNLMDELRTFMSKRQAPFRLKGLRAIFVTPEEELDKEDKVCRGAVACVVICEPCTLPTGAPFFSSPD